MTLELCDIRTGEGFGNAHIAEIYAPKNAAPSSLASLTRFLNGQEGVRAIPGYDERSGDFILRVSGFKDDISLHYLLEKELPLWQTDHHLPPDIVLADNARFSSVDDVRLFSHQPPLQRFVKSHASQLSGLSYMVGNLGLLYSAWNGPPDNSLHGTPSHDMFKAYSGAAYMTATLLLLCFGREADQPRDVRSIVSDAYENLVKQGNELKEHDALTDKLTSTLNFIRTHPWEITACLNASGAMSHIISAGLRISPENPAARYEALSALGTLTAMVLVTFAPTEQDVAHYTPLSTDSSSMYDTISAMPPKSAESFSAHQRISNLKDWIGEHAMQLASGIQAVSNIGYGIAALRQPQKDEGLLIASAGYISGNIVQTQADKARGAGYDELVTSAARLLRHDPELQSKSETELHGIIHDFAGELHQAHDVTHSVELLEKGIASRLYAMNQPPQQYAANLAQYNNEEWLQLKESPFVGVAYLEQLRAMQSVSSRNALNK